jgi:hypothetical protein
MHSHPQRCNTSPPRSASWPRLHSTAPVVVLQELQRRAWNGDSSDHSNPRNRNIDPTEARRVSTNNEHSMGTIPCPLNNLARAAAVVPLTDQSSSAMLPSREGSFLSPTTTSSSLWLSDVLQEALDISHEVMATIGEINDDSHHQHDDESCDNGEA